MTEDMYLMTLVFGTSIVIVLGLPLVRAYIRRQERAHALPPGEGERDQRLARIESSIETMAVEIERISEGQRFVTKLLAEREAPKAIPASSKEHSA
ncbi:MAG: hypothetical protein K8S21_05705 [Gemmatimonadetes bacterium]|nr:hypothetical protein [Gemmatimonadota bacterium]